MLVVEIFFQPPAGQSISKVHQIQKADAIYLLTQEIIKFTSVVSEAMDIGKSLSLKSDVLYANSIMSNQSMSDELALESNQLDLDMGLE